MKINKKWYIAGAAAITVIISVTAFIIHSNNSDKIHEVTKEEMEVYREMIGSSMDEKRAVLVIFNTQEECRAFIEKHGADDNPSNVGEGVVPIMENGYYNIVGKSKLEEVFDTLKDGEYSKEPVMYAEKYCYLKRLSVYSPVNDDKALKEIIQSDKEGGK